MNRAPGMAGQVESTDIERLVEDPQRKELVAQVRKKIDELGKRFRLNTDRYVEAARVYRDEPA